MLVVLGIVLSSLVAMFDKTNQYNRLGQLVELLKRINVLVSYPLASRFNP